MSEADAESTAPGREIWIEKYRPQTLEDIHGQEETIERLQSYIEGGELPHLLFSGPAGVGKCLTGETPVLTSRGVERIGDAVGDVEGFGDPDSDLEVVTFGPDGTFEYVSPSQVYGKSADDLLTIETRDGGGGTVTPEHRLLTLTEDGLEWKQATEVEPGDRIARPHTTPTVEDPSIHPLAGLDSDRIVVRLTESFAAEHGTGSELGLDTFRELDLNRSTEKQAVERVQYVNASGNRSEAVEPVWEVTPQLARFVGLAVSEARIDCGRIKFYNTDDALLDAFERAAQELFGVETVRGEQKGVPFVRVVSRTLTHLLESTFDVFACASGETPDAVGSGIVTAGEEARAAFVRAMFDAEAYVSENGIVELTQRREGHITLLSYLLSTLGIPNRRTTEQKAATNGTGTQREYHTLYVSGANALQRFEERAGFSVAEKQATLETAARRSPNPNHDTMPRQAAARELCSQLNLPIENHLTRSMDPENPGREAHCGDIESVLEAATERIETAQEVLERLEFLRPALEAMTRLPTSWTANRERLGPLEARKQVAERVGVRTDRLLEYADGRRTPSSSRVSDLLVELDAEESTPDIGAVKTELRDCVESLGVSYEDLADGTELRGTGIISLLEHEDSDIRSLTRFESIADHIQAEANGMLSADVLERLSALHTLAGAELYYDEVTAVEPASGSERVYDLTVPGTRNYVAGDVPTVMHNTTSATAIAREIYGDDWRGNFLELNASDERGIDVVRDRIKNFARSAFGGHDYRIIFLDEADSLTSDAQSALRRTMEQFSDNTRFILSCNYSSKIIDPIQSRCAVFRFSPLSEEAIGAQLGEIAEAEDIEVTEEGFDALVYAANGDMRRGINSLQAAATTGDVVDAEAVYAVTATARPEDIEEMVAAAVDGDFPKARATLDTLLTDVGMAGGDIIDQLHRSAWGFDLSDRAVVRLLERLGEADYRIAEGASEQVQLEALLAALSLDSKE